MSDRLFIGTFPTGISYADKKREKNHDYLRVAFLPFSSLKLEWSPGRHPPALRAEIEKHAGQMIARRGQSHQVSTAGQTVTLGSGRSHAAKKPSTKRIVMKPSQKSAKLDREVAAELAESAKTLPRFNPDVAEDPRPGFYYVTAIDGGRSARIAGPYKSHGAALDKVRPVKDVAETVDPRAIWWAWGTMRSETDLGPGALGVR